MRTVTIIKTYYQFHELSPESQRGVIEKLWDINVDHDWWDFTYEYAKNIGLEITGFDIYYHDISGKLTDYTSNVAERILKGHGETTETYKLAEQYIKDRKERETVLKTRQCQYEANVLCVPKYDIEELSWNYSEISEDDFEVLNTEFERALKEEYLSILRKEYEYLTSEESIIETIEANEYEFDEEGNLQ